MVLGHYIERIAGKYCLASEWHSWEKNIPESSKTDKGVYKTCNSDQPGGARDTIFHLITLNLWCGNAKLGL